MELSRIKVLHCGVILQLLFVFASPLPYTKYGRTCSDIGCLSSQVCVMAYESCSIGQREGNDCGRFPTCKKNTDPSVSGGPSAGATNVYSNGPKPSAPVASGGSNDDDVLGSLGLNPNNPYGQRPAPAPTRPSLYPSLPTNNNNGGGGQYGNGGYSGGGGGGQYGNGGYSGGGGGGGGRPSSGGSFDGAGGNIVVPTQKPAPAGGGGFFGGILSGVQNAVSNAVKQQVGTYINQRLGLGPAAGGAAGGQAGGLGGLFDARNLIDTKRLGGLFSENNRPAGTGSSQGAQGGGQSYGGGGGGSSIGPGGYPVTVDQRTSASQYAPQYAQPGQSYGYQNAQNSYSSSSSRSRAASTARPAYGWNTQ
ncbi:uncharacterized protein LOC126575560 [Anopheles aquasalis]|uniref:uncharacterized protein LOC126575560 n=1 Tax=Anopheles aquasalis TaxID=42839 RepID=UPI00215AE57C|nr:uncharacterized protein LOC126575560 [Anopheles aquasalis]XP_050092268.1 uncharacterized protein LOC126575560 [Anopheles aquasalis]XP_050092269.1 uncharacterized protein LOC126575560 [Anopheles aquasalis]XP_050092270.1 uncharacterized protein LOC126575560 [Anopheles aquasalis]